MRPAAVAFLAVLVASVAAWALLVLPAHGRAAEIAGSLRGEDIRARAEASRVPAPTEEEARAVDRAMAALDPGAGTPAPRGMAEEVRGTFGGRLPWAEVQGLLAWAAAQPRAVLELEVKPAPGDAKRAQCRVVFAP